MRAGHTVTTFTEEVLKRQKTGTVQKRMRGMLRDENVACQGKFAGGYLLKLLDCERGGLDDGLGFGVVVVVEDGGGGGNASPPPQVTNAI